MAFTRKVIHQEDERSEKYFNLLEKYIAEIPRYIIKKHNYLHGQYVSKTSVFVCADDDRDIYLVLIHFEDCREFETPMAWVLFVENQIMPFNCDFDNEMGVFDDGSRWLKEKYLVEPLKLPESFVGRDVEIKKYISDGLTEFASSGFHKITFTDIKVQVVFDQPYVFLGNQN